MGEGPEKFGARQRAEKSRGHPVTRVGNVAVLYRPKPVEENPLEQCGKKEKTPKEWPLR
jgi:hypothetical protein